MSIIIVEIKARCQHPESIRSYLENQNARFAGRDQQIDTYYHVDEGRLKLREGDIENTLIYYRRPIQDGPKRSDVELFRTEPDSGLKSVLDAALRERIVVDKSREIYFLDNVKFHIDEVVDLGSFVEIEAIDEDGSRSESELLEQCQFYISELGIDQESLMSSSYSEMLLDRLD